LAEQGLEAERIAEDEPRTETGNGFRGRRSRERAAARTELTRKRQGRPGFRWGSISGGFGAARQQSPASSEAGAPETMSWPFVRARKRQGWRAMVAVEAGQPAGASPFETRCSRRPASAGDGGRSGSLVRRAAQAAGAGGNLTPGGTTPARAGGILGSVFAPELTRRDCMEEQQRGGRRAAGTRYRLPARTDSEGKVRTAGMVLVHPDGASSNRRAEVRGPETQ
jgi:hypothetical protein